MTLVPWVRPNRFPKAVQDWCRDAHFVTSGFATPPVFERGSQVPLSGGTILDPVQNPQIVAPGQFGNSDCKISGSGQASAKARM
jgi:hypothetical protein